MNKLPQVDSKYQSEMERYASEFLYYGDAPAMGRWLYWIRNHGLYDVGVIIGEPYKFVFSYNYQFLTELGLCYFFLNEYRSAFDLLWLTYDLELDEGRSKFVHSILRDCMPYIQDTFIRLYPVDEIKKIQEQERKYGMVTFTMTTCKRLDLFKRTLNSFLHCCMDKYLIDEWIVIDDNSSEEDRDEMKRLYPFIKFIFKTSEDKGHPRSMNILRRMVKTPFVFHLEDDWQFFVCRNYITDCIRVLEQNHMYGQCLVNKNYAETPQPDLIGGEFKSVGNLRYYEHTFQPNTQEFVRKFGHGPNCAYWPHYSLRAGMTRTRIYDDIGEFYETVNHFEQHYAYRYASKGYKTAFLETIHAIHIGRLTSEINTNKDNAYTLNNEKQFTGKEDVKEEDTSQIIQDEPQDAKRPKPLVSYYVINLDRRPDRMTEFEKEVAKQSETFEYKRVSAVDGNTLQANRRIEQLFNDNDYNYRRGIIGCALSHINLWIELSEKPNDIYLILEDDVKLIDNFFDTFVNLLNETHNWDIIFLGNHCREGYTPSQPTILVNKWLNAPVSHPVAKSWSVVESFSRSLGGTGGYVITSKGAKRMLDFIQERGMTNAIDTMMQHACDYVNIFYAEPHLIVSDYATPYNINDIDTDIQRDFSSLRRDVKERIVDEENWCKENDILVKFYDINDEIPVGTICKIGEFVIEWVSERDAKKFFQNYRLLVDGKYSKF